MIGKLIDYSSAGIQLLCTHGTRNIIPHIRTTEYDHDLIFRGSSIQNAALVMWICIDAISSHYYASHTEIFIGLAFSRQPHTDISSQTKFCDYFLARTRFQPEPVQRYLYALVIRLCCSVSIVPHCTRNLLTLIKNKFVFC